MRPSLCSHQVSDCLVCPCVGEVVFGRRWLSRAALRTSHSAAQCLSTISISRTLERDTFRRCFLAQPAPTALQSSNRRKRALLLRDLVATADLPLRNALFSLQLLDLTHRWWAAREGLDIDIHDPSIHPIHPIHSSILVLETIRTGAMRVIHIPVKTEETQRLRIKFVLYCPICALNVKNQTS